MYERKVYEIVGVAIYLGKACVIKLEIILVTMATEETDRILEINNVKIITKRFISTSVSSALIFY